MLNGDGALNPEPEKWNNVACSGNTFDQALNEEFLDEPKKDGKNGDQVIDGGYKELEKPEFTENAKKVIRKALEKGRGTSVGPKFAVFVSGKSFTLIHVPSVLAMKFLMILQQVMPCSSTKTLSNATTSRSGLAGTASKQSISPESNVQK